MRLTEEQTRFYGEAGYVAIDGVAPDGQVRAMRDRIEELCEAWDTDESRRLGMQQEASVRGALTEAQTLATVRKFSGLVDHEPVFARHATDEVLLDLVEALIGAPVCLYADQALLKPPHVGSEKMPHQDNAYFKVEPGDAVVTAWCALDDATPENGCMHYIPGSHRAGAVGHAAVDGTPHLVPNGFARDAAIAVPIRAGGVILHHAESLHFSPVNTTDAWRRAFVCHYVRADATMPGKDASTLRRVRG
jgi:phytanoyl-CoA hydroxylase